MGFLIIIIHCFYLENKCVMSLCLDVCNDLLVVTVKLLHLVHYYHQSITEQPATLSDLHMLQGICS